MIKYMGGDIFALLNDYVLVNPVNTVGVMGAGLAKKFANKYPRMYREYQRLCAQRQFSIGDLFYWETPKDLVHLPDSNVMSNEEIQKAVIYTRKQTTAFRPHNVLNFPTKEDWRQQSRTHMIEMGCIEFVHTYRDYGIHKIAFPQLGCGLGRLNWKNDVKPILNNYLKPLTDQNDYDLEIAVVSYKRGSHGQCVLVDEF